MEVSLQEVVPGQKQQDDHLDIGNKLFLEEFVHGTKKTSCGHLDIGNKLSIEKVVHGTEKTKNKFSLEEVVPRQKK